MTQDLNTLICLFHHQQYAQSALEEVLEAGIPEANVTLIGAPGSSIESSRSSLAELNVPSRDLKHLLDGINGGGAVLSVSAISADAAKVESIFAKFRAGKIDEADVPDDRSADALPVAPLSMQEAETATQPYADGASSQAGSADAVDTPDALLADDAALGGTGDRGTAGADATEVILITDAAMVLVPVVEEVSAASDTPTQNDPAQADTNQTGFDPSSQPVLYSPQVF